MFSVFELIFRELHDIFQGNCLSFTVALFLSINKLIHLVALSQLVMRLFLLLCL